MRSATGPSPLMESNASCYCLIAHEETPSCRAHVDSARRFRRSRRSPARLPIHGRGGDRRLRLREAGFARGPRRTRAARTSRRASGAGTTRATALLHGRAVESERADGDERGDVSSSVRRCGRICRLGEHRASSVQAFRWRRRHSRAGAAKHPRPSDLRSPLFLSELSLRVALS